jgi:hypothetical protein
MLTVPGANVSELVVLRDWITNGVKLELDTTPAAEDYDNTSTVIQHADTVRARLQEYIAFGAVVSLPDSLPQPFGIQPLHVIIKPGKKARLVIDLSRNLNDHLRYEHFSYSNVIEAAEASWQGCWYGKLDLSNCFLSFPLHVSAHPHFIFRFEEQLYGFVNMPFGLASAPRICTLLLSVVAHALTRRHLLPFVRFLDDFLFISNTETRMCSMLMLSEQTFHAFGLVVNVEKTEGPAQQLVFLGIQFDSLAQTISCTSQRVQELQSLLRDASRSRNIRLSVLNTLIGKLSFAATVLPGARPFMRRMLDLRNQHITRRRSSVTVTEPINSNCNSYRHARFSESHRHVHLDSGFKADSQQWLRHLHFWNGSEQWRSARSAPICFASDASLEGFGFYIESTPADVDTTSWPPHLRVGAGFSGKYATQHRGLHDRSGLMTWCELFAVYAAMSTYAPWLRHRSVRLYVDNSTDVAIINRQATRSAQLAGLLRELYGLTASNNIQMDACHRSGVNNVLADFLSRPQLHKHNHIHEWQRAHPTLSASLRCVSVVSSQQFVNELVKPQ